MSDMWVLDLPSLAWSRVDPIQCRSYAFNDSSVCPGYRAGASSLFVSTGRFQNKLLVYGGGYYFPDVALAKTWEDLWSFDPFLYSWSKIVTVGENSPAPRKFHAASFYNNMVTNFYTPYILNLDVHWWWPGCKFCIYK